VRIPGLIGFLMVDSMGGNPEDGSPFERKRATDCEEIFHRQGYAIGPVGQQTMITHAYAESDGQPIQNRRNEKSTPTEHEQSRDRSDVKEH
jgi:hypothetical protein